MNPEITEDDIVFTCSYLTSAYYHKIPLNFDWWPHKKNSTSENDAIVESDLARDIVQKCFAYKDTDLQCLSWGNEQFWKIGAKGFLDKLLASMDKIIAGEPTQKMEINFAHDTSIAIILAGMGYITKVNPPHATTLFIELHQEDDGFYTMVLFNGIPLTYGPCTEPK